MKKIKLGDLLLNQGIIEPTDLERALHIQSETGQRLGDVLVALNLIEEDFLLSFIADLVYGDHFVASCQ